MIETIQQIDQIRITPYVLHFLQPARTSRSVMQHRLTYLVEARSMEDEGVIGWGECAPLEGLSPEDSGFHQEMKALAGIWQDLSKVRHLIRYPSFLFGLEAASLDFSHGGNRRWFDGGFADGYRAVAINGLIWMGGQEFMYEQIRTKLSDGYPCLKLKIGGIDFEDELKLLKYIRTEFSPEELELRLDANGSFLPDEAEQRLLKLSEFSIHSIEQPIRAGQPELMARLCELDIIPIALDEELIGLKSSEEKGKMLHAIRPHYLIFKPSLIGGLEQTQEYIQWCHNLGIEWWITSALESNVGLNVLAQFCDHLEVDRVQGLGTGKLFSNNIPSPLRESRGKVFADPQGIWGQIPGNEEF